jgi:hypothetical protein
MFFKRSTSGDLFYKNDVRKGKTTKRDVWRPKLQFRTSNLCILATSLLLTVRGVRFGQIRKGATQAVVG